MQSMTSLIGSHDIVMITLDTLRFDVANEALESGRTPQIQSRLPKGAWELRHTPATFTFAAHQAFFAGFLPTPDTPGPHPRLFASKFGGSETTNEDTFVFEEPEIVSALAARSYRTICIGGVGFFNKQTSLGSVLPNLFEESHWSPELSVTDPASAENQVKLATSRLTALGDSNIFLFLNISALHQPNCFYLPGASADTKQSQLEALVYVDVWLGELWKALERRKPGLCILCSDHGTAYGEDGYTGHRLAHPAVWNVPYAEFLYGKDSE